MNGEEEFGADVLCPLASEDVVAVRDKKVVGLEIQNLDLLRALTVLGVILGLQRCLVG